MQGQAKHKLCRRVGSCLWNNPKCPSVKRPFPAGQHGQNRRQKLSTYGVLLLEKQKLKGHYAISEKQLRLAFQKAKKIVGLTNENLVQILETRLDAVVYRSGLVSSIFAAKQTVNHRHILVNGKIVDRSSFAVKDGDVISINIEKSPVIAENSKKTNSTVPAYLEVDVDKCKAVLVRKPLLEEIPVNVESMRVIEYYAR